LRVGDLGGKKREKATTKKEQTKCKPNMKRNLN
jgi:hypothetical protein